MNFQVSGKTIPEHQEEVLVLGIYEAPGKAEKGKKAQIKPGVIAKELKKSAFHDAIVEELEILAEREVFYGQAQVVYRTQLYGEEVIFLGLGKKTDSSMESLRKGTASLYLELKKERYQSVAIHLDSLSGYLKPEEETQAIVEGLVLTSYEWGRHKSEPVETYLEDVVFYSTQVRIRAAASKGIKVGEAFSTGTCVTRDFANEPPNQLTPANWAKRVQALGKKYGFQVKVLDKAGLKKEKMGAFLGVNAGSANEPRLVQITLNPKRNGVGKGKGKTVALVGKGLVFDSGGISLKPSSKMEEMKFDKAGGCTVIGAMVTLAMLGVKNKIQGYIGMTDNMPGSTAQVPSDIVTARNGKTIEVVNTDAEGRLVLCDVLDYAQDAKPDVVVDLATLTGAVVVALAEVTAGLMTNNNQVTKALLKASEETAERIWHLPLYEEYFEGFKSDTADFKNIGTPGAGSQKAAIFLKQFVRNDQKWAHLDIAGVAWNQTHLPYAQGKGGTGACTRLLAQFAMDWN